MATAGEPLSPFEVLVLGPGDVARPLPPAPVLVLVARAGDPGLALLDLPSPDASDLADEARPAASPRGSFRLRRAVTRALIARRLGCAPGEVIVGYDGEGAPQIRAPQGAGHVSVAGRDDFLAVALADQPVGVDVEPLGAPQPPVAAVLHASERAWLATLAEAQAHAAFLSLWTAKEAGLKAVGLGLNCDPASLATCFDGQGGFVLDGPRGLFARGRLLHGAGYVAAVAILAAV